VRLLQRQVPLPLPCVNFAQIAHVAIPWVARADPRHATILPGTLSGRDGRCVQSLI